MEYKENIIRCLIVDDEPPAHRMLERYISEIPYLELVAKCINVFEASTILLQKEIDLIFLDINMPKMSGMDFLRTLKNPPYVIITTAYSEYALEGFELNVSDYLHKPFSFERFFQAINKVSNLMQMPIKKSIKTSDKFYEAGSDAFIFLRENKVEYKVNVTDILYLESVGDYVKVHTVDRVYLVYQTLKNFETQLEKYFFMRVHKSFIIPFSRIESIEGNTIKLKGQSIPIGVTYRKEFFEALERFKMY